MTQPVRMTVIGAGSTYTPELVEGLGRRAEVLGLRELVLHDIDDGRLAVVGALAGRILRRLDWAGNLQLSTDLDEAVRDAAAVFVQIRVGGQAARLVDETLPLRFGVLGQETTGPGGFAKALRTVPVMLDIAERVRLGAAPDAWIVDFTNPVGIVTRALLDAGHRAVGLCNVAIGLQRRLAGHLGVKPAQVRLEHVGLNHLSWLRSVEVDGVDRLPELLAEAGDVLADETGFPPSLLAQLGCVPSYYLRYYWCRREVLAEQRRERPRAAEVADIEAQLLEMYADPALAAAPPLLASRGGAFYSEAAAALVTSLLTGDGVEQVVDVRCDGALPGLAPEDVIEVPCRVDRDGAHPLGQRPLPAEALGLVQAVTAYEMLAVAAAVTGDRSVAHRALIAHPLVGDAALAAELLDAILEANAAHLTRFVPAPELN